MSSEDQGGRQGLSSQETVLLWLDLEADGQLSSQEAAGLETAIAERPELAREVVRERAEIGRLHEDLRCRVAVREGFCDQVMQGLPAAAWKPAGRRGWAVAAAAAAVLAVLSGALLSYGGLTASGPGFGVLAAIGELLRTSALTGAGLLGASWRGLGLALQQALEGSPTTLAFFGVGVLTLNLLFLRLLRRHVRSS